MNIAIWLLAGGLMGWLMRVELKINPARGVLFSAIIGVAGAFFGGYVLTPIFAGSSGTSDFSAYALAFACVSAAVCLIVSDKLYVHFEV